MTKPYVVKLGGSLLASPALDALLGTAAAHGAIVVPGGGPFADAVRIAQAERGFGEAAAHAMAILAMEQTAFLLADRAPAFALCATREGFANAAGRPTIWCPAAMALDADLPRSWDVTSDSLALWLATALGAPGLVLVKSARVSGGDPTLWAAAGLVDRTFPSLAAHYRGEIVCVGEADISKLDAALSSSTKAAA
nr:aspartate kinase [Hansschlegelia quercus]